MKAFHPLLIAGSVLILLGVGVTWGAFDSGQQRNTFTIPPGELWHVVLELTLPYGGQVLGEFQATSGGIVDVYVFDEQQYSAYFREGKLEGLAAVSGSLGDFAVTVPLQGKYYIAVDHGAGYEEGPQEVRLSWRVLGLFPLPLTIGLVSLVVGIELVGAGVFIRRKMGFTRRGPRPSAASLRVPPSGPPS